ncbi:997_t:CDS:2, partial [Diversispora eburnea]
VYKLFNMERAKSIKTIKNSETFKKEERKLNMLNYSMEKIFSRDNTNNFEIREELKMESLVHQKIAKAKEKNETIKQIQKAIEKRWEDLKDNLKRMISSILDKSRKSIVMDRIVKEISDNNTIIITEGSEIKELSEYTPLKEINNLWYDTLYNEVKLDELEIVIQSLPNNKAPGQSNLQYEWFKNLPQK